MSRGVSYTLADFQQADDAQVLGALTASVASTGIQTTRTTQIDSWKQQILILRRTATGLTEANPAAASWHLILEYELPRRQKRPDAVLLASDVILVVEFKVGANSFDASSRWQTEDYCLNLRDFHAESVGRSIVPVLCATAAAAIDNGSVPIVGSVAPIQFANAENLAEVLATAHRLASQLRSRSDRRAQLDRIGLPADPLCHRSRRATVWQPRRA